MQLRVKLFASLRKQVPSCTADDALTLDLDGSPAVAAAVACLGFPPDRTVVALSRNGRPADTASRRDGREIRPFPPLAGGR